MVIQSIYSCPKHSKSCLVSKRRRKTNLKAWVSLFYTSLLSCHYYFSGNESKTITTREKYLPLLKVYIYLITFFAFLQRPQSLFCGATGTLCFGFHMNLLMGLNTSVLCSFWLAHNEPLKSVLTGLGLDPATSHIPCEKVTAEPPYQQSKIY